MGQNEFQIMQGSIAGTVTTMDIKRLLAWGTMALPIFTVPAAPAPAPASRAASRGRAGLAVGQDGAGGELYCALMADLSIGHIGSANDVVIDGVFADNALFCRLLAGPRYGPDRARLGRTRGHHGGRSAVVGLRPTGPSPRRSNCTRWNRRSGRAGRLRRGPGGRPDGEAGKPEGGAVIRASGRFIGCVARPGARR